MEIDPQNYPVTLREKFGTFVTLYLEQELRGCIGSLEPRQSLIEDVVRNAYAAAFSDPRFAPVRPEELSKIGIEVAVLSPLHGVEAGDESALLELLEPGVHGVLIEDEKRFVDHKRSVVFITEEHEVF